MPASEIGSQAKTIKAFFYGTLMHPKILKRVIGNDGSHLDLCPAVLMDYTRHKVKNADYPGIVPYTRSRDTLFRGRDDLTQEEKCVRGTLVAGLTRSDIRLLDYFEGAEYARVPVKVYALGPFVSVSTHSTSSKQLVPAHPPPLPEQLDHLPALDAETYVFLNLKSLKPSPWDFADFVKRNAWKWYGEAADNNEDITEVDRRRERGEQQLTEVDSV